MAFIPTSPSFRSSSTTNSFLGSAICSPKNPQINRKANRVLQPGQSSQCNSGWTLGARASAEGTFKKRTGSLIRGRVFVVGNNIDTDQIIPAEYLTLVPSNPEEYAKLGTYAMDGLPQEQYPTRYVTSGAAQTEYPIIVAGDNFGCGSSREHAPVAIGAAGGCAVVARSYARIFFRNCSATGELYPWEIEDSVAEALAKGFTTGQMAVIDFDTCEIRNEDTGESFKLKPLGDVLPVIDAGGIFEYARETGMIAKK